MKRGSRAPAAGSLARGGNLPLPMAHLADLSNAVRREFLRKGKPGFKIVSQENAVEALICGLH